MKKILILVAMATTMSIAGYYTTITQPDGTVIECYVYVWADGSTDMDCS